MLLPFLLATHVNFAMPTDCQDEVCEGVKLFCEPEPGVKNGWDCETKYLDVYLSIKGFPPTPFTAFE
eukprot:g56478.t1